MRIREFLQEFLPLRETGETLGILLIAQKVVDEFLLNLFFVSPEINCCSILVAIRITIRI